MWKRKKSRIVRAQEDIERLKIRYCHLRDHVHGDIEDLNGQVSNLEVHLDALDTDIWSFVHQLADDLNRDKEQIEQLEKLVENDGISINIASRKAYFNQEMSKIILDLLYALGKSDKFRFIHHCETNTFAKERFERHNKGIPFIRHTRPDECPLADPDGDHGDQD